MKEEINEYYIVKQLKWKFLIERHCQGLQGCLLSPLMEREGIFRRLLAEKQSTPTNIS